jgi:23S rRNA pseudouridine2457 synthase
MPGLILFNKPYNVLSQFSGAPTEQTLAHYINAPGFYPAGRLDKDSEGLLLLTDCGRTQQFISDPAFKMPKTYWTQVEQLPDPQALLRLKRGVVLNDGPTRPALARLMPEPPVWPRKPPIRVRQSIPTQWLELIIKEGRNRQVRRMTAAIGHPTLRLIRVAIGPWTIGELLPGQWQQIELPDQWWQQRPGS